MKKMLLCVLAFVCLLANNMTAQTTAYPEVDIAYKKFTLSNGLTVIIHEDHKAPIVCVNVWYHVGSKNERAGKTGFAHLFEHLMFNGSENHNFDYFKALERIGGSDVNGTTNNDRTNYFQNVPVSAFDQVLFLESDRMGHLLGAIDQAKLDEQRGVVQNEKRQGENQPYAVSNELTVQNTYPAGHPYSWTVIGSMDDLNAASLEDVKTWFKTYYGAANATVVIAGDISTDEALAKVKAYFGDIPSGPPVGRHQQFVAKMTGSHRMTTQDRVAQPLYTITWNTPEWASKESTWLTILGDVLATSKSSRLYKRLVQDEQLCTQVFAYQGANEIAGQFQIGAVLSEGASMDRVEAIINEELNNLLRNGITEAEMHAYKMKYFTDMTRSLERIGGFGGKSDILAQSQVFTGDAGFYKTQIAWVRAATAAEVQQSGIKWLGDGSYILTVMPFPEYTVSSSVVDRSKVPELGTPPSVQFPDVETATLSNGMKIVLARRASVPIVRMDMLFDAGYAADQGKIVGTAGMVSKMMMEGAGTRNSTQLSEALDKLGAMVAPGAGLDASNVYCSTLKSSLDGTLDLYADIVMRPTFPDKELERLKKETVANIDQEKTQPSGMAMRVLPKYLYGEGHAYNQPLSGSGTEESVAKMTRTDLTAFHTTWYKPNNATIVVVGDITMAEIKPKLEARFGTWAKGSIPVKNLAATKPPQKNIIYLMDKPGAIQSVLIAGSTIAPTNNPDEMAFKLANNIVGGDFMSRLNMNLREDKHWSYGATAFAMDAKGQRPYLAYTQVQTDKTKESVAEMFRELNEYVTTRPATKEEFERTSQNTVLGLPGQWESSRAVLGSLDEMVKYGYTPNYFKTYADQMRAVTFEQVTAAGKKFVQPKGMTWLVVGDRAQVEKGLRELGIGEVILIDENGNIIDKP